MPQSSSAATNTMATMTAMTLLSVLSGAVFALPDWWIFAVTIFASVVGGAIVTFVDAGEGEDDIDLAFLHGPIFVFVSVRYPALSSCLLALRWIAELWWCLQNEKKKREAEGGKAIAKQQPALSRHMRRVLRRMVAADAKDRGGRRQIFRPSGW